MTAQRVFLRHREFLRALGVAGVGLAAAGWSEAAAAASVPEVTPVTSTAAPRQYLAARNPKFNPGWTLTDETLLPVKHFYEFSVVKNRVHLMADKFVIHPWKIEIAGLVEKPFVLDAQELIQEMPLEERVYRFRCVGAWSMVLPWAGFPLSELIEKAKARPEAKFVRFETFNQPEEATGMTGSNHPFPYFQGLRMDEAMHPLSMVATGIYGKPMPKQPGASVRLSVPRKYGHKSIKSIFKIEFMADQPEKSWEVLGLDEYPFESNVNPAMPHPRWLQSTERVLDTGDGIRTLPQNGYGDPAANFYSKA